MSLHLTARVPARGLAAEITMADREVLALIGANGSGKSSTLAVAAGLLAPGSGRLDVDGRDLTAVPPHRRRVALMTQQPNLFERLSVQENVAFGPRSQGVRRDRARQIAHHWLAEVAAADLADRRPGELSGGQAQRVALARALAANPDVLLLDEPLAALDVAAAGQLRHMLRDVLAERTAILVTHDALDVVLLADRVAVLDGGRVVEAGSTARVMRRPGSAFAAHFFGWNFLCGTAESADALLTPDGRRLQGVADRPLHPGSPAVGVFRPASVAVHLAPPHGSPRNSFVGPVTALEPLGHLVRVRAAGLSADITAAAVAELGLGPGVEVWLVVKAASAQLSPV